MITVMEQSIMTRNVFTPLQPLDGVSSVRSGKKLLNLIVFFFKLTNLLVLHKKWHLVQYFSAQSLSAHLQWHPTGTSSTQ